MAERARRDRSRRPREPAAWPRTAPPHVRAARPRSRGRGALAAHRAADDLSLRHDPRRDRLQRATLPLDGRPVRARPRAPRFLWMRNGLPVLRRSGVRPRGRGTRGGRGSPLPPSMNDLRARVAQIVERDRAPHIDKHGENGGTGRNPLYATADPPASGRYPVARGPSAGAAEGPRFAVLEKRIAIDEL